MESSSERFGERLKHYRGKLSQAEFARFLGVPNQSTYHRYEAGRIPKAEILNDWSSRIGITLDQLLGNAPFQPAPRLGEQRANLTIRDSSFSDEGIKDKETLTYAQVLAAMSEADLWNELNRTLGVIKSMLIAREDKTFSFMALENIASEFRKRIAKGPEVLIEKSK